MKVKDIMTSNPTCCTPDTQLQDIAQMMLECDCGEIPVVDDMENMRPIGVITDRDIVCRAVARGKNPLQLTAKECMSVPCITVDAEAVVEDCCRILEENQIRRLPVVDKEGCCCGMLAQADLATHDLKEEVAGVLEEVSKKRF